IGIGPILWSRQKGETEYALSALPFGGYVKMLGQDDMDPNQMTSSEIAENARSYSAKPVWQRMAIISAGVVMNVITGFLFFTVGYWYGVNEPSPVVGDVWPGFPAWTAGMKAGDRIDSVNGEPIRSFEDVWQSVVLSAGDVRLQGQHLDGSDFDLTLKPERGASGRSIGIYPTKTVTLNPNIIDPEDIAFSGFPAKKAKLVGEDDTDSSSVPDPSDGGDAEKPDGEVVPKTPFRPGDRLIALQSEPVKDFADLQRLTAKYASQDLVYTFERTTKGDDKSKSPVTSEVNISVPPAKVRSIGLWMAMGPVRAIRSGSVAEKAGLQVGDIILSVDNLAMGSDFRPGETAHIFCGTFQSGSHSQDQSSGICGT
ncbi:MAG: hypothetical protein HC814_08545, partial [Rhodobacteraceae bacterium]|nr:hypothetical protein [Paracoccaceae bacterium]